jgi:hypothetical protein
MFKPIKIEEEGIGIPCYGSDKYYWLTWNEEEVWDTVMERHSKDKDPNKYTGFHVWPDPKDQNSGVYSDTEISVYEMICHKTQDEYLLLCYPDIHDWYNIKDCVAFPNNYLNLIYFFNKYLLPLAGKPYIFGD